MSIINNISSFSLCLNLTIVFVDFLFKMIMIIIINIFLNNKNHGNEEYKRNNNK